MDHRVLPAPLPLGKPEKGFVARAQAMRLLKPARWNGHEAGLLPLCVRVFALSTASLALRERRDLDQRFVCEARRVRSTERSRRRWT